MLLMNKKIIFSLLFLVTLAACTPDSCREEEYTGPDTVPFDFVEIDKQIFNAKSENDLIKMMDENPLFSSKFLQRNPASTMPLAQNLLKIGQEPNLIQMEKEASNVFGDYSFLKNDMGKTFARIKYYYPEFEIPKVYTIISGFGNDVFAADSIIVIGVDFFIGPTAKYRPEFPEYMLKNYTKENIMPGVALMISNKYNQTDLLDKTMLAEMIYWGKAYYFMERIMPCTPDSLIIGYTNNQLTDTKEHERVVWEHFITNKLLYSTEQFTISKYIGERPNITEIGNKCPGRVARWLGWQIIKAYMQNNSDVSLQQLMAEKDAKKIFTLSGYKP